jgi:hypothetical protein
MNNKTVFSLSGLNIGAGDRNLTYFYGLSDFWQTIFEDSDKIELLLEAQTVKLSDIYSRFLQLAGTISIEDVEVATSQQIRLILIKESDAVAGKVNTYKLPESVLSTRIIANRPLLPTAYLEDGVHYTISTDGTEIQFYTAISSAGFASRLIQDNDEPVREFALWFVDSLIDEKVLYQYFGKLIGIDEQLSTERFRNFIYGLYYLRANGPNLALVRKGLNLCLGIPLARTTEVVLDIRKYLDTDQFIVITDLNSYLIPFGLAPTVAIGDTLEATQELAQWIEVKDYTSDGEWWINLQIPPTIMPYIPPGEVDRYAKTGSYAEYVMKNYLKKHTFLVNVKTIDFKNLQSFSQLSTIINEVKPLHSYPIYIWTVPTLDETLTINDGGFTMDWENHRCEDITVPISSFKRFLPRYTGYSVSSTSIDKSYGVVTNPSGLVHATAFANIIPLISGVGKFYWETTLTKLPSDVLTPRLRIGVGQETHPLNTAVGSDAITWAYTGTTKFNSFQTGESWSLLGETSHILRDRLQSAHFDSSNGCYLSTGNTPANDIYQDMDIRVEANFANWLTNTDRALMSKWKAAANKRSWSFELNTNNELVLYISANGSATASSQTSGLAVPFTAGKFFVRVTRASLTGVIKYYVSDNGTDWTQLGSDRTSTPGDLFQTDCNVNIGARNDGIEHVVTGNIYSAYLLEGINGTVVSSFDANLGAVSDATIPSVLSGEVWTLLGTAKIVAEYTDYYMNLKDAVAGHLSTIDSAANSITSDIELRAKISAYSYTPTNAMTIAAKFGSASTKAYQLRIMANGTLRLTLSQDGSSSSFASSSISLPFRPGQPTWIKATWRASDGKVQFFTSPDQVTWTQLGSDQTIALASIADTASNLRIGSTDLANTDPFIGKVYETQIRRGIGGPVTAWFRASDANRQTGGLTITNAVETAYGVNLREGDTVGTLIDTLLNTVTFYVNGVSQGLAFSGVTGTVFPMVSVLNKGIVLESNFGDKQFTYAVPSGAASGVYVEKDYITRDCPLFTRSTVSHFMRGQFGDDPQINGDTRLFDTGVITGYVNSVSQMRVNSAEEKAWYRAVITRDSESYRNQRSIISFTRSITLPDDTGVGISYYRQPDSVNKKVIFMYATTQADLETKFSLVGAALPGLDTWSFTMFRNTSSGADVINDHGINEAGDVSNYFDALLSTYNQFFFRGSTYAYLGSFMPLIGYQTYAPATGDLRDGDYLLFIRIYENTVGVYWVTSNNDINLPTFRVAEAIDPLALESDTAKLQRGLINYSSYYLIRGGGGSFNYTQGAGINERAVNEAIDFSPTGLTIQYSDEKNPTPLTIDRSGVVLKFRRDLK